MDQDVLHEQIAYYRARAQEYDETTGGDRGPESAFVRARDLLRQRGPFEQVLELASGTGTWTRVLLEVAQEVIALDASPEMLALAGQKLGDARVHYRQADLFQWEPDRQYPLVFFANWLSHVPPSGLASFLDSVVRAVQKEGSIVIVDQYAPSIEDQQIAQTGAEGEIYAQRPLRNGQVFTIVKVFYEPAFLQQTFAALGFTVAIRKLDAIFFFLEARRSA